MGLVVLWSQRSLIWDTQLQIFTGHNNNAQMIWLWHGRCLKYNTVFLVTFYPFFSYVSDAMSEDTLGTRKADSFYVKLQHFSFLNKMPIVFILAGRTMSMLLQGFPHSQGSKWFYRRWSAMESIIWANPRIDNELIACPMTAIINSCDIMDILHCHLSVRYIKNDNFHAQTFAYVQKILVLYIKSKTSHAWTFKFSSS